MPIETTILLFTAVGIACLHTLAGPDHYLPFIVLARSRNWSAGRTIFWTLLCGCGHVWSSVLLALCGAAIGWSLSKVSYLESIRGGLAGWALLLFGLLYTFWGFIQLKRGRTHKHFEIPEQGPMYVYEHRHGETVAPLRRHAVTPWVLFIIFVLGPCEPMIPLLYLPAAKSSWYTMAVVVVVYTLCTLFTMLVMVLLGFYGIAFIRTEKLQKYIHVLGGATIFVCGAGMVLMDW